VVNEGTVLRRLLPEPAADVPVADAYHRLVPATPTRPAVRANMIASVDGAAVAGGLTKALGGPADRAVFFALRSLADVIVVGAGTVRAERYGPVRLSDQARAWRVGNGLPPVAPIAVITASAHLDWQSAFFTKAEQRPLVITVASVEPDAISRAAEVADVIVAGDTRVDLAAALAALGQRGYTNVLTEGGPILIGEFIAAGLLDELCLTIAPKLVSGDAFRIVNGAGLETPANVDLRHVLVADGYLFLRYTASSNTMPPNTGPS
jgi:riboflavin biosynthesis pyrimidine reductase